MSGDYHTRVLKILLIIVGIIDAMFVLSFFILLHLINSGVLLSSVAIFVFPLVIGFINLMALLYIPIFLKYRKDR